MGVTNALYNYGFQYENPDQPYDLEGFVNSAGAVAGLEFYKELYDTATPPVRRTGTWARISTLSGQVRSRCR